jgi:hypothetical protein
VAPRAALPPLAAAPLHAADQVGRLAVLSLGSPDWWPEGGPPDAADGGGGGVGSGHVLRMLLRLKAAVRERRCAAAVSVPAALHSAHGVARMAHLADAVLALESVADDSDIVRWAGGVWTQQTQQGVDPADPLP